MHDTHDQAIKAALKGDWELAVELNLEILESFPENIAALNRLGRAYTELGQKEAAKNAYEQVLAIDKYDTIATKNLHLLPHQKSNGGSAESLSGEDFIELPGITKTSPLIKVASRDTLLSLVCKQQLNLVPRTHLMAVTTNDGTCIGCLPDDLSLRLKSLTKSGYLYTTCLKSASDNIVSVFIREIKRPKRPTAGPTFSRTVVQKKLK